MGSNAEKKPTVFVRNSTGLVRNLSLIDGMILNLSYFNLAVGAFIIFGLGTFLFPGSNMVITIGVIALLLDLPIAIAYGMFSASMPRSGGDYIYVSRGLHPALGFAAGLVFFIFLSTFAVGLQGVFTVTFFSAPSLAALGSISSNSGLVTLSQQISQRNGILIIGTIVMLITFVLLMVKTSTLHKVLLGLFILGVIGWPIIYIIGLAASSNAQFITAFNAYATHIGANTTYTGIIQTARSQGASIVGPTLAASLAATPIIYASLAFPQASTYVGGETKRPTRSIPLSLILGLVVSTTAVAIMGYFTYNVFGYDFVSATSYLSSIASPKYPLVASPYPNYLFLILYPNVALNWFMFISTLGWNFLLVIAYGTMATRAVFAFSFDRLIPSWFADVSQRFYTPIKANILVIVIAEIFLVLEAFNFLGTYVASIIGWTSGFLVVMMAATLYPLLKKSSFNNSPSFVKAKVGKVPLMSILGGIGAISLLIVFYFLIVDPSVSGASVVGIAIVAITWIIGAAAYYGVRAYRKTQGADLDKVFQEIPPE